MAHSILLVLKPVWHCFPCNGLLLYGKESTVAVHTQSSPPSPIQIPCHRITET